VAAPATASFKVKAQGSGPLQYQWEFSANNGGIWSKVTSGTGINSETYVTTATDYTMNGYLYRCQVSGSITPPAISQSARLIVNSLPVIISPPESLGGSGQTSICNEFWIGVVTSPKTGETPPVTGNIVDATTTHGSQVGKYILLIVAGALLVAVTVFSVNVWMKKRKRVRIEHRK
ncbi:MAG: hypothetical protein RR446_11480, partial [Lachnospiraceae bacterium]